MDIKLFTKPAEEWDEFASHYSNLIFYKSRWAETMEKGLGALPLYFYLKNSNIVAGMPGILIDLKLFKILYSTISYGNFIGEDQYRWLFTEQLERELARLGIDQIRVIDSPFSPKGSPPTYEPCMIEETSGVFMNLKGLTEEKLYNSYGRHVRWQIRKARERGVTVHEVESENDFHFFYLLYLKSMIRNKAPAKYSQRMFKALRELVLSDLGSLFLAKVDGFPVAGHLVLYSDKVAHSMFVGSDDKYLKDFFPNKLLMHFVLSTAIDYGSEIFDFGGSDKDDLELIKFKKLWGGKEITTKTYVKDYSPIKCKVVEKVREWLFN